MTLRDEQVQVSARFAEIPAGESTNVFTVPLRVVVGEALKGRRLGIQYKLLARNLRAPATGTLRLLFT